MGRKRNLGARAFILLTGARSTRHVGSRFLTSPPFRPDWASCCLDSTTFTVHGRCDPVFSLVGPAYLRVVEVPFFPSLFFFSFSCHLALINWYQLFGWVTPSNGPRAFSSSFPIFYKPSFKAMACYPCCSSVPPIALSGGDARFFISFFSLSSTASYGLEEETTYFKEVAVRPGH